MNENFSDPTPEPGVGELQGQNEPAQSFIDSQQPLREYASAAPALPPLPDTPQPGYPGQAPMAWPQVNPHPGQSVTNGYPSYPGQPATNSYPPHPGQPAANGYPPYIIPYPGAPAYYPQAPQYPYGYYAWPPTPPQPKRDTYLLVIGILGFASSCFALLGGLVCFILMVLVDVVSVNASNDTQFAGVILFLTLSIAGVVGGGFCAYHSIRSLFFRKPSGVVRLPQFWTFLVFYLLTLGIGYLLHSLGQDVASPQLTALLIYLGAIFPALSILALGIRRLRFPGSNLWPTTWRRLTLALVSGSTLAILLASILELVIAALLFGLQNQNSLLRLLQQGEVDPGSSGTILAFILLAVVAPVVEELVKPLAVVALIGRVNSKAEAFALGLACGIGFNLVETTGYISSGYSDWLNVALVRSGAGLLHGFGAAMMALGWYYLTSRKEGDLGKRLGLALACGTYAILQHSLWNGSWGLALIPGQVGTFVQQWSWSFGPLSIDIPELINVVELLGILSFFIYMAGRLRTKPAAPSDPRRREFEGQPRLAENAETLPA